MSTPLAIYVHLPWCVRKCPYCDFNSHVRPDALPEREYVAALLADLDRELDLARGRQVASIFLGGGTPSLFAAGAIAEMLDGFAARLPILPDVEITMEANPGTIEHGRFAGYARAGVNRVSLGAQSFDADRLRALGRIHGPAETSAAVAELADAGIANFNLDLMYALPGQTRESALTDLEAAIALRPAHLSHYQLTLEPGTTFFHRPPPLPDDDLAWQMQLDCQQRLAAAGFAHYEVSAYARTGRQCRHNLNYWRFGDYLGIGAGAHSKISFPDRIMREMRYKQPKTYMEQALLGMAVQESKTVQRRELPFEFMMNALRLTEGFKVAWFEERTGLPLANVRRVLEAAEQRGLIERGLDVVRPTALGRRFLNDLLEMFLPDEAAR